MCESAIQQDIVAKAGALLLRIRTVVNVGGRCYPQAVVRRPAPIEDEGAVPDDVELVRAMARGDSAALGSLYDRHAARMFSLAKKIVITSSAAEDIVQEVFLEAWKKAASYDPARGGVKSWLLLRTRSRSIDFRRATVRCHIFDLHRWRNTICQQMPWVDYGDTTSRREPETAVRRALSLLPKDQREALWLGYFEGLSSAEIAARVGSPVGTIKTRVAAALSKLRAALSDRDGDVS